MIVNVILLIIVGVKCSANLEMFIKTSEFNYKSVFTSKGEDNKLVTDKEIYLFNITEDNLKKGVRVELGKVPDDIFLKDPTPYEDLFHTYEWKEVTRKLIINKITLLEFMKTNEVLSTCEYVNNTTYTIKKNIEVGEVIENTVEMGYPNNGLPEDKIYFNVTIDFDYGKWRYQNDWRNKSVKAVRIPFFKTKGLIELTKGQNVVAVLSAAKIIMLHEINFKAYLIGSIIANYEQLYGKYHFWAPSINNIMKAGNLTNEINTKVLMELRFYAKPKLKLFDKDTGEELDIRKRMYFRKIKTKPKN